MFYFYLNILLAKKTYAACDCVRARVCERARAVVNILDVRDWCLRRLPIAYELFVETDSFSSWKRARERDEKMEKNLEPTQFPFTNFQLCF